MNYTYSFIDQPLLADRTDLPNSYAEENVRNAILDAQRFEIYDILGKNLYDRFDTDFTDNLYNATEGSTYQTDNPDYVVLMEDYIVPCLIWGAYVRVLDTIWITPNDNGLAQLTGGATTPVDTSLYKLKREQGNAKFIYFQKKLIEYLSDNSSNFDEYYESRDLTSDYPQIHTQSSKVGVFVSKNNSRTRNFRY